MKTKVACEARGGFYGNMRGHLCVTCWIVLCVGLGGLSTSSAGGVQSSDDQPLQHVAAVHALANSPDELPSDVPKPYCRLYGVARRHGTLTDRDLRTIAASFDVIEGGFTREEMDAIRQYHPQIKFIYYMSPYHTRSGRPGDPDNPESKERKLLGVYLAAKLAEEIDAVKTVIHLASVDSTIRLRPSNIKGTESEGTQQYVTWLTVDDEFMRIEAFDQEKNLVTVTRGFDRSTAVGHKRGTNVFSPIYVLATEKALGGSRSRDGRFSSIRYVYRMDLEEVSRSRAEVLLSIVERGFDGAKFDHMGLTHWAQGDAFGNPKTPWDFEHNRPYTPTATREVLERRVNYMQDYVFQKTGKIPVVFGNGHSRFFPAEGGTMFYMMKTEIKPHPIGTQWENFVSVPHTGLFGSAGGWKSVINLLNYCAKHDMQAAPLITFEEPVLGKNTPEVLQHEKYGYASYLMGYEPGGRTLVSQSVFRDGPNETKVMELLPWCYYEIGVPSQPFVDAAHLQMENSGVYVREFTKGLVLVNPDFTDVPVVSLKREYYDPDTKRTVTSVAMPAHTGKILLLKP